MFYYTIPAGDAIVLGHENKFDKEEFKEIYDEALQEIEKQGDLSIGLAVEYMSLNFGFSIIDIQDELAKNIIECLMLLPATTSTVMKRCKVGLKGIEKIEQKGEGLLKIETMLKEKYNLKEDEFKVYSIEEEGDKNIYIELSWRVDTLVFPFHEFCMESIK